MAEENVAQVDEKCCLDDANPMETIDETSVVTMPIRDDVLLPAALSNGVKQEMKDVNSRRFSTGVLDKRGPVKAQVQTRYRGNQTSSTHDLCKHGKRREDDVVIKPWKLVKKKNVESGDSVKVESMSVMRKSLGNVKVAKREQEAGSEIVRSCDGLSVRRSETKTSSTPPSDSAVERKVKKANLDVKKVSRISEDKSSSTEDLLTNVKSREKTKVDEPVKCEGVSEKKVSRITENKITKEDVSKNLKSKEKTKIDHEPVQCEDVLVKKVSRISENKSTKEDLGKNMKNKEKITKSEEPVKCEDKEKTLYVVETSIEEKKMKKSVKTVKGEIQQPSEKKFLRGSSKRSPTLIPSLSPTSEEVKESRVTKSDPRPIRQTIPPRSKTGLSEKKESGSANLVTKSKPESKIFRPKRISTKVTPPLKPTMQLNFKKGNLLEPKPEVPTPTLIKFKKRVVPEPKLRSDVNKWRKTPKDKREGVRKIVNGEGKREKVVLRHRKVEAKKKLQTLFNNVIEEAVSKLEEVRKSKVKALVGAFETVISLQDDKTKTSQKKKNIQSESTSSSSQVVEAKSLAA